MEFKKLLEELNGAKIIQTKCADKWFLDFEEVFEKLDINYANDLNLLDKEVDIDGYSNYRLGIRVYMIEGVEELLGVNVIDELYSEEMDYGDAGHTVEFFEMEAEETITYTKVIVVEGKNK